MKDRDPGQCLTDETLTEYLEGSLDLAVKAASEVHLVACEACRNRLAFFMRVLQPGVSPEEAGALTAIAAEWDANRKSGGMPQRKPWISKLWVAIAGIAAVIVVLVSGWMVRSRSAEPSSPAEVIRLLLEQNRPFESRIAGQPHRPMVRTRGSDAPGVSYSLLAAEMTRLSANNYDMGRFYLLQKDFSRAIPYLVIAEKESGAAASVHNDLGVAYLENGQGDELQQAESEFLHAIQQDRGFAPAVFNLALLYERTNAAGRAQAQWAKYLELDSKSEWAAEARARLQGLTR